MAKRSPASRPAWSRSPTPSARPAVRPARTGVTSSTGSRSESYELVFYAAQGEPEYAFKYYPEKASYEEGEVLEVTAGGSLTANTTLAEPGSIEGAVTGEGEPLASASVCLYQSDGVPVSCTVTGKAAGYSFANLPAGSYVLGFEGPGFPTQYGGGTTDWPSRPGSRWPGESDELRRRPEGPTRDRRHRHRRRDRRPDRSRPGVRGGRICRAPLRADRGRRIRDPTRPRLLRVWFESDGHVKQFWEGVTDGSEASLLTVGELRRTGIDAALAPAGSIAGTVTAAADETEPGGHRSVRAAGRRRRELRRPPGPTGTMRSPASPLANTRSASPVAPT